MLTLCTLQLRPLLPGHGPHLQGRESFHQRQGYEDHAHPGEGHRGPSGRPWPRTPSIGGGGRALAMFGPPDADSPPNTEQSACAWGIKLDHQRRAASEASSTCHRPPGRPMLGRDRARSRTGVERGAGPLRLRGHRLGRLLAGHQGRRSLQPGAHRDHKRQGLGPGGLGAGGGPGPRPPSRPRRPRPAPTRTEESSHELPRPPGRGRDRSRLRSAAPAAPVGYPLWEVFIRSPPGPGAHVHCRQRPRPRRASSRRADGRPRRLHPAAARG